MILHQRLILRRNLRIWFQRIHLPGLCRCSRWFRSTVVFGGMGASRHQDRGSYGKRSGDRHATYWSWKTHLADSLEVV